MPMSVDLFDLAVVGVLEAELDFRVFYGTVVEPTVPYVVYHPIASANNEPGMGDPLNQEEFQFQVRCVGKDSRQVRWLSAKVRSILLSREGSEYASSIPGFNAYRREANLGALQDGGSGIEYCTDTYTFHTEEQP